MRNLTVADIEYAVRTQAVLFFGLQQEKIREAIDDK